MKKIDWAWLVVLLLAVLSGCSSSSGDDDDNNDDQLDDDTDDDSDDDSNDDDTEDDDADDDTEPSRPCFEDADHDGYGNPDVEQDVTEDECPAGFVTDNTDCNDTDFFTHPGALESADDGVDQDCNDVDLVHTDEIGVFVSPAGNDANAGTMAAPKKTLAAGAVAAATAGKILFVAGGTYPEHLSTEVSIYGGYATDWSERDPGTYETQIGGVDGSTAYLTVAPAKNRQTVVLEGLQISNDTANNPVSLQIEAGAEASFQYGYLQGAELAMAVAGGTVTVRGTSLYSQQTGIDVSAGDLFLVGATVESRSDGTDTTGPILSVGNDATAVVLASALYVSSNGDVSGLQIDGDFMLIGSTIQALSGNNGMLVDIAGSGDPLQIFNSTLYGEATADCIAIQLAGRALQLVNVLLSVAGPTTATGVEITGAGTLETYSTDFWLLGLEKFLVDDVTDLSMLNACGWNGCEGAADNFADNPLLDTDGIHLTAESACVDAGTDPTAYSTDPRVFLDIDFASRPLGEGWDVGADELIPPRR